MFHFGMPTLLEFTDLEMNAKYCADNGLKFVEINMNMPEFQIEALDKDLLIELMEKYNIYFTFHMADNLDIANFQQEIREINVELVRKTLAFAESIDSPIVNMHMQKGVYFTLPTEKVYIYDKYLDRYLGYVSSFHEEIEKFLDGKNVKLAIENTGDFNLKFMKESTNMLLESKQIYMTYDIGHDHSFGNDREFVIEHLERIRHMHVHDAVGMDHHLALGSGEIKLERYIGFAKNYQIRCVIEAKTIDALTQSIQALPVFLD